MSITRLGPSARPKVLLVQAVDYDTRALKGFPPLCTPVSIATIAALTPDEFDVELWDENLVGWIDDASLPPTKHYDIVGISALFEHIGHRIPTLAAFFRARGTYVCAGGPGISNQLKAIGACVDSMFLNEAEYTWPQFLKDWTSGNPKKEYIQISKPNLADSPPPVWGSISERIPEYRSGGIQTSRGCPFDCEFCDVIYLYGRAQRHKPIDNVLKEVSNLQQLGISRVFFTDDEFIGDPEYARALLTELVKLNNSFDAPLKYNTQLTLNLSRHEDILALMADANFSNALIGIESFSQSALLETGKIQNCHRDIVEDCRKILSYGIGINGSFIVGFDHDDIDVFENIIDGVQRACIPFASVSILRATFGTKLWTRLRGERRLWKLRSYESFPEALRMDIMPGGKLSRAELIEGRIYVNRELSRVDKVCERLNGWISLISRMPNVEDSRQMGVENALQILKEHSAFSLAKMELDAIEDTLEHARRVAPIMISRVVESIINQLIFYRVRTYHTEDELKEVLIAEKDGDLVSDDRPITIPGGFIPTFKKRLFPVAFARLWENLSDTSVMPEAMAEVFVDFIVRLREHTESSSGAVSGPEHEEFIRLLCDRTAARLNGVPAESVVGADSVEDPPIKQARRAGLPDAVLKEVGDRLVRINS